MERILMETEKLNNQVDVWRLAVWFRCLLWKVLDAKKTPAVIKVEIFTNDK